MLVFHSYIDVHQRVPDPSMETRWYSQSGRSGRTRNWLKPLPFSLLVSTYFGWFTFNLFLAWRIQMFTFIIFHLMNSCHFNLHCLSIFKSGSYQLFIGQNVLSGNKHGVLENGPFSSVIFLLNMVIFPTYVRLLEVFSYSNPSFLHVFQLFSHYKWTIYSWFIGDFISISRGLNHHEITIFPWFITIKTFISVSFSY